MLDKFSSNIGNNIPHVTNSNFNELYGVCNIQNDDQLKENIFKLSEEEINEYINYSDQQYIPLSNDNSKPHFKLLYSLNIPNEVKQKVEEKIITSQQKASKFTNEIMCCLVITAYRDLNLYVNDESIIRMFGLDPNKTKVMQLLSKATTKLTVISDQETTVTMVIINPSEFIEEVFNSYVNKYKIIVNNKDYMINKIKDLTKNLENYYPIINQSHPREKACAIIYLYLKGNSKSNKRGIFNETVFSELPLIIKSNFKTSLKLIQQVFNDFSIKNVQLFLSFYN